MCFTKNTGYNDVRACRQFPMRTWGCTRGAAYEACAAAAPIVAHDPPCGQASVAEGVPAAQRARVPEEARADRAVQACLGIVGVVNCKGGPVAISASQDSKIRVMSLSAGEDERSCLSVRVTAQYDTRVVASAKMSPKHAAGVALSLLSLPLSDVHTHTPTRACPVFPPACS